MPTDGSESTSSRRIGPTTMAKVVERNGDTKMEDLGLGKQEIWSDGLLIAQPLKSKSADNDQRARNENV